MLRRPQLVQNALAITRLALRSPVCWGVIACALTLLAAALGLRLQEDGIALFWPAAGVGAGLILLAPGRRRHVAALGIFIALSIGNASQGRSLLTSLVFMACNLAEYYALALLLERSAKPFTLQRVGSVLLFVTGIAAIAALVGLAAALGLRATGHMQSNIGDAWWLWFTSHAIGILCVTPALLSLRLVTLARLRLKWEDLALPIACAALALVFIGSFVPRASPSVLLAFVLLPPILWWVLLHASATRAAWAILAIATITIWQTTGENGAFAGVPEAAQFFLVGCALALLPLGAAGDIPVLTLWIDRTRTRFGPMRSAVVLVPLMFFAAFAWWSWRDIEGDANERLTRVTQTLAEHAQRVIEVQIAMLEAALAHVESRAPETIASDSSAHEFLKRLDEGNDTTNGIALIRADTGRVLLNSRIFPFPPADLSDRSYIRIHRERGERLVIGEFVTSPVSRQSGFTVSLFDRRTGLVAVSRVPPQRFRDYYQRILSSESDRIGLIRADGTVLARFPESDVGQLPPDAPFFRLLRQNSPMPMSATSPLDRMPRRYALHKVGPYPLYIVQGIDSAGLRADWLRRLAPFGLLALFSSTVLFWLTSRIVSSTEELEAARLETDHARAVAAISERLTFALTSAAAGAWEWEVGSQQLEWSKETFDLFGADSSQGAPSLAEWYTKHVQAEDRKRVAAEFKEIVRGSSDEFVVNYRTRHPARGTRWISARGRVERQNGRAQRLAGLNFDITDLKLAEVRLRESEARFRNMADHAPVMVWVTEPDGQCTYLSESWYEFTGQTPESGLGLGWLSAVHHDDRARTEHIFRQANRDHTPFTLEYRLRRQDGAWRWAIDAATPRFDPDGAFAGYIGSIIDISERKDMEEALEANRTQLALFIEHAPAAIAMFDFEMRFLAVSRRFLADYRLPKDVNLIGQSHYDVLPEMPQRWRDVHNRVLAGEELAQEADTFVRRDGKTEWVSWSLKPWRIGNRVAGLLMFTELRTEQINAQRALASSEQQLRLVLETANAGIWAYSPDTNEFTASDRALALHGIAPGTPMTRESALAVIHPDDRPRVEEKLARSLEGGERFEVELRIPQPDGSIRWIESQAELRTEGGVRRFLGLVQDITSNKRAEEGLRRSYETYLNLIKFNPFGVYLVDSNFCLAQVSAGAEKVFTGVQPLIGRDFKDIIRTIWQEPFAGEVIGRFRHTLATGEPYHSMETTERRGDIDAVESYDWRIERVTLPSGKYGVVCYFYDMTERKRYEQHINLLLREVNHRAKNMLSVVQSVARHTAASEPDDFVDRFELRVQALAANQDLLIKSDWKGVPAVDLVRAQLVHFADLLDKRILMSGPPLVIAASASQALSMALHELGTNAAKYGALSNNTGLIEIAWSVERSDQSEPEFVMTWRERGGPPVTAPHRRGFGTTVTLSMMKLAVGADVSLNYQPHGLVWRLACPASHMLEVTSEQWRSPTAAVRNQREQSQLAEVSQ